jgi:hypothetical protein
MSPPLKCEAANVVSDFGVAPERRPQIGNGSFDSSLHAKGAVSAIVLKARASLIVKAPAEQKTVPKADANGTRFERYSMVIARLPTAAAACS